MKLQIIPSDKLIIIDGTPLEIEHGDLSWIPDSVYVFRWDDSTGEGEIETLTEGNSIVKEIGIYSKAVEIFNEEIAFNEEQARLEYENSDWELIIRKRRNRLLTRSDWVVTRAKETGTNIPAAWKTYRQALRDITEIADSQTYKDMCNDKRHELWPIKPHPFVKPSSSS
jgi:hypothetical protein